MSPHSDSNCTPPRTAQSVGSTLATRTNTMNRTTRTTRSPLSRGIRAFVVPIIALLATGAFSGLQAQVSPTPEGDTIPNIAEVTFSDANGNTYAAVADTAIVVVGFQGSLLVVGDADVQPAADTDGNEFDFTLTNNGNGTDTLEVNSVATGNGSTVVENISYRIGATPYADLTALNAALAVLGIAPGDAVVITVVYDAVAGSGGLNDDVTLTASSTRTGGTLNASDVVNVAPPLGGAITVVDPADQQRLPSGGATPTYTMTFDVTSTLSGTDNVDLVVSLDSIANDAGLTIVSIDGTPGTSKTLSFSFNETKNIDVVFTVADNAAGSVSGIRLVATAQTAPNPSDRHLATVTIIRPALTITKAVFTDASTSIPVSGEVLPGQSLWYRITVTNSGTAPAANVEVEDVLDAQLSFVSVTQAGGAGGFWTLSESSGVVTATRASFPTATTQSFVIAVTVVN